MPRSREASTAVARRSSRDRAQRSPDCRSTTSLYVDLAGFQGVVDTLGGVDMCIPGRT